MIDWAEETIKMSGPFLNLHLVKGTNEIAVNRNHIVSVHAEEEDTIIELVTGKQIRVVEYAHVVVEALSSK
jgi:uncharacterized protein YlzI (FlbEa/FlbD family)